MILNYMNKFNSLFKKFIMDSINKAIFYKNVNKEKVNIFLDKDCIK